MSNNPINIINKIRVVNELLKEPIDLDKNK
jgi:hypothetical protein